MIHLLDLENSVLTVSNGIVLEKEDCLERQSITDKIIKNAKLVTVRGRGDADSPIVKSEFTFLFKKHSTYFGNGRSLNFLAIWNDKRDCHSIFNEKDDPCLRLNHHLNE